MHLREDCDVLTIDFHGHSELQGSLSPALCEFPELYYLRLKGTEVSGDLAMLASCEELSALDLSKTNVTGDLKAVQNARKLWKLSLSNTKVEGDIESLQQLTKLSYLDLENTNVSGDMASLREAKDLQGYNVKITGSRITGGRCSPHLFQSFCPFPLLAPVRLESGSWQAPDARATRSCSGRCCLAWASKKSSSAMCVASRV